MPCWASRPQLWPPVWGRCRAWDWSRSRSLTASWRPWWSASPAATVCTLSSCTASVWTTWSLNYLPQRSLTSTPWSCTTPSATAWPRTNWPGSSFKSHRRSRTNLEIFISYWETWWISACWSWTPFFSQTWMWGYQTVHCRRFNFNTLDTKKGSILALILILLSRR